MSMAATQTFPDEPVQLTLGETYPEIRELVRRICSDFPAATGVRSTTRRPIRQNSSPRSPRLVSWRH